MPSVLDGPGTGDGGVVCDSDWEADALQGWVVSDSDSGDSNHCLIVYGLWPMVSHPRPQHTCMHLGPHKMARTRLQNPLSCPNGEMAGMPTASHF